MSAPRWMSQATSEEFSWYQALGGTRGVIEATAPGLIFVIVYVATHALTPTLVAASSIALIACIIRLIQRQSIRQALSGFFGVGVGVVFAAATGRGENYFVWGIITNVAMSAAFAVSVLVRAALVGFFYAAATGLPQGWRTDASLRSLRHSCDQLTWLWAGIFGLRAAVQAPLWASGAVAALGVAKLALGLPLFALGAWLTWRGLRPYSPLSDTGSSEDGATDARS